MITTPGVLPHIPRAGRERLIDDAARRCDAVWITIDPPGLHDGVASADRCRRPGEGSSSAATAFRWPPSTRSAAFVEWRAGAIDDAAG